jgi:CheY-like chemotaxis protein
VRAVLEQVLREEGYTVLSAHGPDRALEIGRSQGPALDLLVSDVVMPGMSGTELAERLRAEHGELPVLLVTGYAPEFVGETSEATELLEKPFTSPALLQRVRALLEPPQHETA